MAKKRGRHGGPATDLVDRRPRQDAGARWHTVAIVTMATGLLVLTALACVLSYPSLRALGGQAALSPTQAKAYPIVFDATLLIAGCAVLALRGAGVFSRIYAWLSLLVLLAALAAGGVVRAAAVKVPRQPAAIAAAAIPWALVLIGFGLLITLLGYARRRRSGGRAARTEVWAEIAQPEADDDAAQDGEVLSNAGPGETGAGARALDSVAGAGGLTSRARVQAPPADLQLRARVPASRAPSLSEMMPHDITTPSGTIAPADATPADHDVTPADGPLPPAYPAAQVDEPTPSDDTLPPMSPAATPSHAADTVSGDTMPGDTMPGDPAPGDTMPGDTAPGDAASGDALSPGSTEAAAKPTVPKHMHPPVTLGVINDDPPAEPPALRRPHSSPTPPED